MTITIRRELSILSKTAAGFKSIVSFMKMYDVSVPLSGAIPTYPGDPGIKIEDWRTLAQGDSANVSFAHFGLHSGTHVDAPAHFIEGGSKVNSMPLESLIGEAVVVEVPDDMRVIDANFVRENWHGAPERILFKTRNSAFWSSPADGFREDYTYLHWDAATFLVDSKIKLVGIDYLSIEEFQSEKHETHLALLSKGVVILEGLDLREVPGGRYELICLPLRIDEGSGDGAPARVVLRTLN